MIAARRRAGVGIYVRWIILNDRDDSILGSSRYLYAVIGMEAFHHFEITLDTPTADHFLYNCGLGFVDFKCSLYMVFQLLTTSNWHEIMNTVRTHMNLSVYR